MTIIWAIVTLCLVVVFAAWLGIVLVGPPYVPTLRRDLEQLLATLEIGAKDHVVDLGAGDGRVLAAAARRKARATGVELNPFLVLFAWLRLRQYKRATISLGDIWRYTLPEDTTYVFVFFAQAFMPKLETYLEQQAQRGRSFQLVSFGFSLPHRQPKQTIGAFHIYTF